jgi:hypothetical protein
LRAARSVIVANVPAQHRVLDLRDPSRGKAVRDAAFDGQEIEEDASRWVLRIFNADERPRPSVEIRVGRDCEFLYGGPGCLFVFLLTI